MIFVNTISTSMKPSFTNSPIGLPPTGLHTSGRLLSPVRILASLLTILLSFSIASAQQTGLSCSLTSVPIVPTAFGGLSVTSSATGFGSWGNGLGGNLPANVIDGSVTNYAQGNLGLGGSVTLRVNSATTYAAGNYAGFVFELTGLNVNVISGVTIRTYLGTTLQETVGSANLLGVSLGTNRTEVGFYTDMPYDGLEITYTSAVSLLSSFDVYYAVMRGTGSCAPTAIPPCNAPIRPRFDNYAAVVDPTRTGITGVSTASWANLGNLVDTDTTNFASLDSVALGALATVRLGIKRTVGNFDSGSYAGFDIQNRAILGVGLLSNLTLNAYRGDTLVSSATGSSLLLGATLLGNSGRQTIGFVVTGGAFDEIEMVMTQPVAVSIGATNVYGAVIRRFCAGPVGPCNIPVAVKELVDPVYINGQRTGFTGGVCALCRIDSLGNLLDNDTLNRASIVMVGGVIDTASIAIRNAVTTYPGGTTYAGFELSNPNLLTVNVLNNTTVEVWRNGVRKQRFGGNDLLISLPSSLIAGTPLYKVGFVPDSAFDEVRLSLTQTVGISLGTTYVYRALVGNFCPGAVACRSTTFLNAPAQSVYIDQRETGITGLTCALCAVTNPENAISPSTTDFAQLVTTLGVSATSSLAVKDAVNTYPAGTIAGFAVGDPNNVLQLNLLRTIRITTFNNGVPQETATAGQLLNLSLLILQVNPSPGYYNLGIRTTLPFDEVKVSIAPFAGVAPVLNVYGAYVDTRFVDTVSNTLVCGREPVAEPDHFGTPKGMTATGSLRTNDHDPANLQLTYNTTATIAPKHGTVTIGSTGTFSYVPVSTYSGLDSFSYTVCNTEGLCSIGWAYISVLESRTANGPNTPHIVQPDRSETTVNVPVPGNAAANDIDIEQRPLIYSVTTAPLHGTLSMTTAGVYVYTPDSSYVGRDSAFITVCDTATPQICRSARLELMVYAIQGPANKAPYAADDVVASRAGVPASGNVLTNDKDPDNTTLTANVFTTIPTTTGVLAFLPNGSYTFTPAPGFVGTVNVPYAIIDGNGGRDTANLSITIVPYIGPDYTPTITLAALNFTSAGQTRDFRVSVSEVLNSANDGQVVIRIFKPSAFNVIFSDTITVVSVGGGPTAVSNANWVFVENASFVTCTLKPSVSLNPYTIEQLGFRLQRKPGVAVNTSQNLTVSIANTSGGDANNGNNQYATTVTAQ